SDRKLFDRSGTLGREGVGGFGDVAERLELFGDIDQGFESDEGYYEPLVDPGGEEGDDKNAQHYEKDSDGRADEESLGTLECERVEEDEGAREFDRLKEEDP